MTSETPTSTVTQDRTFLCHYLLNIKYFCLLHVHTVHLSLINNKLMSWPISLKGAPVWSMVVRHNDMNPRNKRFKRNDRVLLSRFGSNSQPTADSIIHFILEPTQKKERKKFSFHFNYFVRTREWK